MNDLKGELKVWQQLCVLLLSCVFPSEDSSSESFINVYYRGRDTAGIRVS